MVLLFYSLFGGNYEVSPIWNGLLSHYSKQCEWHNVWPTLYFFWASILLSLFLKGYEPVKILFSMVCIFRCLKWNVFYLCVRRKKKAFYLLDLNFAYHMKLNIRNMIVSFHLWTFTFSPSILNSKPHCFEFSKQPQSDQQFRLVDWKLF